MNTHDTTGQLIMTISGSQILIARDNGEFEGAACRKLTTIEALDLSIMHPEVIRIIETTTGYSCGRDTGVLFPIDESDSQSLRDAAAKKHATTVDDDREWKSPRGLTLTEEMDREDSIY